MHFKYRGGIFDIFDSALFMYQPLYFDFFPRYSLLASVYAPSVLYDPFPLSQRPAAPFGCFHPLCGTKAQWPPPSGHESTVGFAPAVSSNPHASVFFGSRLAVKIWIPTNVVRCALPQDMVWDWLLF